MINRRIRNARIFIITLALVVASGGVVSYKIATNKNQLNNGVLSEYSKEKVKFDFGNKTSLRKVDFEDIIIGEELHILDENKDFYKQIRTSSLLNKISRNSLETTLKKQPENSINHLYTGTSENLSATSSYYKKMMEFEKEFIKKNEYDGTIVKTITNPFIIKEDGDNLYINDFVYFIDKNTNELIDAINVNSIYNHLEDEILYMNANQMDRRRLKSTKKILSEAKKYYEEIYSKLPKMIKSLNNTTTTDIISAKIYSKNSVIIITSTNGNKRYIEVNVDDFSTKEVGE